jgi:hypothetical protein
MNKTFFATTGTRLVSRFASLQTLVGVRDAGSASVTATAAVAGTPGSARFQADSQDSVTARAGHHADSLDCVAGSEFLDDRLRLKE